MKHFSFLVYTLIAFFFLSSCDINWNDDRRDDPRATSVQPFDFLLSFDAFFGDKALNFNSMSYVTNEDDTLNFIRLRMLLSNIQLVSESGQVVDIDTFALVRFDEGLTKLGLSGNIPDGKYHRLRFTIGLDSLVNHGDPEQWPKGHPLDPLVNQMHWTWASGYIFWVADGYFMKNGQDQSIFSFHMANLNYRRPVTLEAATPFVFKKGKCTETMKVMAYFDRYFNSPLPYSMKKNGPISHSSSTDDRMRMDILHHNMGGMFELTK
jgi:hypothetical protein